MDLEFGQKNSKLKAQSEWVWFQTCSLGVSSVLVPDRTGSFVSEGCLRGKGTEGVKYTGDLFFLVPVFQKSYNFHKNQQNQESGVGEWRGGPKTPSPYVFSDNTPFGSVLVLWPIIKDCFKREATALPDKPSTPAVKCSPEPWETKDDTDEK